jgi:uncharacterized protein (DUF1684 family)
MIFLKKVLMRYKQLTLLSALLFTTLLGMAQSATYADSLQTYRHDYMMHHDVIHGKDTVYFRFFPADESYKVTATFEKIAKANWFKMETSGPIKKNFRVYGVAHFVLHDTALQLNIYQSQDLLGNDQYHDYLFLPFTDLTTGEESYATGRYLDFRIQDIHGDKLTIDFNKAYNPNCAYISNKYNCPVPPKENNLPVAILAGEKAFGKKTH